MEHDAAEVAYIDSLSLGSRYLKIQFGETHLGYGTGFVVMYGGKPFLISAGHVFSGRHAETKKCLSDKAAIPDHIRIAQHLKGPVGGAWRFERERLYDADGKPLWLVHPFNPLVDVAALELRNVRPDIELFSI